MVMPYGHHSVSAELLQRLGIVVVLRQHVHGEACGHVEQGLHRYERVLELGERLRLDHPLDGLDASHASSEIFGLLEVVEGDRGVVVGVSILELEMSCGDGSHDFLQEETTS